MGFDIPPASHFVYIPAAMLMGMVLGFVLGRRTAANDPDAARRPLYDDDLDDY